MAGSNDNLPLNEECQQAPGLWSITVKHLQKLIFIESPRKNGVTKGKKSQFHPSSPDSCSTDVDHITG